MVSGKIVLLPFPFDDLSSAKVRPAVCLTDTIGEHRHVVVAFITSQVHLDLLDTDLLLKNDHPDFPITGLRVNSAFRLHRLLTINANIIQRELGRLSDNLQSEIHARLIKLFKLCPSTP